KLTGGNAVAGAIPPARMQTVLSSGNKAPGYAAGQGDLAALTRAGVGIMQPPPAYFNPLAHALLNHAIGAGLGGAAGYHEGGPGGAVAGGLLGAAGRNVAGAAARSRFGQAYLGNQVATSPLVQQLSNPLAAAI